MPSPWCPVALAIAVGSGALLAGCSQGDPGGADSPAAAVTAFYHALGAKDTGAACAVVSTGGTPLAGVGLQQCELGFEKVLGSLTDQQDIVALQRATVAGAEIDGDHATVTRSQVTGLPAGFDSDIDLVRLGGRWYIDSRAGTSE